MDALLLVRPADKNRTQNRGTEKCWFGIYAHFFVHFSHRSLPYPGVTQGHPFQEPANTRAALLTEDRFARRLDLVRRTCGREDLSGKSDLPRSSQNMRILRSHSWPGTLVESLSKPIVLST